MKKTALIILLSLAFVRFGLSQAQKQSSPSPPPALMPDQLVEQWFDRLNELHQWFISTDGKEENGAVVDRFVQLYRPDAYHQVGPGTDQLGPVVYSGLEGIGKWADDFSKSYVDVRYRLDHKSHGQQEALFFYSVKVPWGGIDVSAEFTAVYTDRRSRKPYFMPGAVFFLFDQAGKIESVRMYMLKDELAEMSPETAP